MRPAGRRGEQRKLRRTLSCWTRIASFISGGDYAMKSSSAAAVVYPPASLNEPENCLTITLASNKLRPRLPLCILFFSSTFGSLFSLEFLFVCFCRTDAIIGYMSIWFLCWRYNSLSVLELTIMAFINIFAITFHEVLNFISFDFFISLSFISSKSDGNIWRQHI